MQIDAIEMNVPPIDRKGYQLPARNRLEDMPEHVERLPAPEHSRSRRTVQFDCEPQVALVACVWEMSEEELHDQWYTDDDLDFMQDDVADAIIAFLEGEKVEEDDVLHTRGLEGIRTEEEKEKLRAMKESAIDAVLEEQERQHNILGEDVCDPEKLAGVCMQHTREAKDIALQLAKADALYVLRTKKESNQRSRSVPEDLIQTRKEKTTAPTTASLSSTQSWTAGALSSTAERPKLGRPSAVMGVGPSSTTSWMGGASTPTEAPRPSLDRSAPFAKDCLRKELSLMRTKERNGESKRVLHSMEESDNSFTGLIKRDFHGNDALLCPSYLGLEKLTLRDSDSQRKTFKSAPKSKGVLNLKSIMGTKKKNGEKKTSSILRGSRNFVPLK